MAEVAATKDLAVKRTAVKVLSTACDGLLEQDAPLATALMAALRSPNDPLFIYNYGVAETEFRRLPRETTSTLMSRCQSRIAENQDDILAEFRNLEAKAKAKAKVPAVAGPAVVAPAPRKAPAKKSEPKRPTTTAVRWS